MNQADKSSLLLAQLEIINDSCQQIEALLQDDISQFSKKAVDAFQSNHEKEIQEINSIHESIAYIKKLSANADADFAQIIKHELSLCHTQAQQELKKLLKEIARRAATCYKLILTNHQVFHRYMDQIKDLFGAILESQSKQNPTYDQKGHMNTSQK